MIIVKVKVVSLFISSGLVNFEYLAYEFMVMIEWEKNLKLWWLWEVYWGLETTLYENVVWVVNGVREVFLFKFSEFLGFSSFKAWVRTTSCLLPVYLMIFYSNKIYCIKKKKSAEGNWSHTKIWILTTKHVKREYLYILLRRCLAYLQIIQQQK